MICDIYCASRAAVSLLITARSQRISILQKSIKVIIVLFFVKILQAISLCQVEKWHEYLLKVEQKIIYRTSIIYLH